MPTPGFGHKGYIQIGKETTSGTAVPATIRLEVISFNISPVSSTIQDSSLYSGVSRRAMYQGGQMVKGTFVVRLNYTGQEELFRAVQVGYTGATFDTFRDHTYLESLNNLNSYTIEAVVGDIPAGQCIKFTGCKLVPDMTIRGSAGTGNDAMVMAEFSVLGRATVTGLSPTALTADAPLPVMYNHAVIMDDGTSDSDSNIRVRSFEVTLSQPHTEDRFYMGALNMDEPMRSDFLAARWRLTQEYTTKTQMDAVINFTTGSPRILFRHPTALKTTSPGAVHNISAAGVFVITRASGSFITDGVLVGHALAGADAATYFPAGTTVTAVTATQVTVDKASLTGPTYAASNRTLTFTTNREVEIRSGSANLTDFSTPVEGFPAIIQTSTWEAWKDGTDLTALYLRIRNEKSALT